MIDGAPRRHLSNSVALPQYPLPLQPHARTLTPVTMALTNAARLPTGRHRSHMTCAKGPG